MKLSNKPNIATGSILLLVAAFFSIALALLPLDFGAASPAQNSILYNVAYMLGNILFSVYGFSSILIPVFLFIAGISCFASQWTARKSMRLLTAIVPFFTSVIVEKICFAIYRTGDDFASVKIVLTAAIGVFLAAIEILAAGILADKINEKLFHSGEESEEDDDDYDEYDDEDDEENDYYHAKSESIGAAGTDSYNSEGSSAPADDVADLASLAHAKIRELAEAAQSAQNAENAIAQNGEEPLAKSSEENTSEVDEHAAKTGEPAPAEQKNDPFADVFDNAESQDGDENKGERTVESANASETPEKPAEPLLSKEEFDALNKINEELIMDGARDNAATAPSAASEIQFPEESPVDELEWPTTDEIISQAGITKTEEESLLGSDDFDEEYDYSTEQDDSDADADDKSEERPSYHTEQRASEPLLNEDEAAYSEFALSDEDGSSYESPEGGDDDENPYADVQFLEQHVQKKTPDALEPDFFDVDMNDDASYERETSENESEAQYESSFVDDFVGSGFENDEDSDEPDEADPEIEAMGRLEQEFLDETEADEDNEDAEEGDFTPGSDEDIEQKRTFLDDMMSAQEDDDELNDGEEAALPESTPAADNDENAEPNDYYDELDDEEEDSSFGFASDIFADMEKDARKQLETRRRERRERPQNEQKVSTVQESVPLTEAEDAGYQNAPAKNLSAKVGSAQPQNEAAPQKSSRAAPKRPYSVPTSLLEQYEDDQYWIIDDVTKEDARKLKDTLTDFGISAEVIGIKKGPVVTMFEIAPAPGVKLSRIVSLQDNIALSLAASSVRIVAPIPGKAAVGIEVPNKKRAIVSFREMIEQDLPEFKKMAVPVILGKDILGKSQIIDIAKTPHLLIAGATGAGKSVCVNSLILSILYKRSPREVKLILVDPKVVELKLYNDIPHLLTPVITEPKRALQALQYCLCEMERRYALLDGLGVRNIVEYNKRIDERNICTEKLPYIVVIIDEFADLMATSGKELESNVARLTAMSRAVGIHLVLATQRPSVNVITGLIKANIPSRIAFMVASRTDSNIIIDAVGAEKLLGKGDMLYASAVDPYPVRIQGTFESDTEVENVVNYVKTLGEPEYIDDEIFVDDEEDEDSGQSLFNEGDDPLYDQALDIVLQSGKGSASYIQRRLKIGYNRAARLVEEMEARGILGPANGSKPREVIHVPS